MSFITSSLQSICFCLGVIYGEGLGEPYIKQNHDMAFELYLKAATQGHSLAENNLGVIYFEQQNYAAAAKWFEKAAMQVLVSPWSVCRIYF